MQYKLWLESVGEELFLLRACCQKFRDDVQFSIFVDWLEEHGRFEGEWLRDVIARVKRRHSFQIYNKYQNGIGYSSASRMSIDQFINFYWDRPASKKELEQLQEWENVFRFYGISLSGRKIKEEFGMAHITFCPNQDIWWFTIRDGEALIPHKYDKPVSVLSYWYVFCAILRFDSRI